MRPTFSGFDLIKRVLQTYQRAQDVVGHNIANAQTPGYSRQEAVITTTEPFTNAALNRPINPGQIGTGVQLRRVLRVHDQFLTDRVRNENKNLNQWEVRESALKEIQAVFGELSDESLGAQLDQFWASWEELSLSPQDANARSQVVQNGQKAAQALNYYYSRLVRLQEDVNNAVKFAVSDINNKAAQIADLNVKIRAIEATGDDANDLRDQRDLLLDELSKIVNVSTEEWAFDQVAVYISSKVLVQDGSVHELTTQPNMNNSNVDDVAWRDDKALVTINGGSLYGNLLARDQILEGYMNQLNDIAKNLALQVNTLQSSGFGLADATGMATTGYNFFEAQKLKISSTNNPNPYYTGLVQGITQLPSTVVVNGLSVPPSNSTTLDALGVTAGSFSFTADGSRRTVTLTAGEVTAGPTAITLQALMDRIAQAGSFSQAIGTTNITYTTKASFDSVNRRIVMQIDNSERNHAAQIQIGDQDGLNANDDTSNFLTEAVSGLMTEQITDPPQPGNLTRVSRAVFTVVSSDAAARLGVAAAVAADPSKLAASSTFNGVPGDGSNALAVANLKQTATMNGMPPTQTLDEFYQSMIDKVGLDTQQAINQVKSFELQLQTLENRKQEVSGVNMDEELIKMVKYQQVYNAAARMMVVMDEMLQSLIATVGR